MSKTNAINWFEIPVNDYSRAKTFYENILDKQLEEIILEPLKMASFPYDYQSGVGGAIVYGENNVPAATGTIVYLNGGDDLSVVLRKVESAGGKVLVEKTLITPEFGYFAIFFDTEGNKVGLHSDG